MVLPPSLTEPTSTPVRGAVEIVRQVLCDEDVEGGYLAAAQQMCANAPTVMLLLATMYADAARELADHTDEGIDAVLDRAVERFVEAERQTLPTEEFSAS